MLKPPAAWLKYYLNPNTSTETPNDDKKDPVSVQSTSISSFDVNMEDKYQQMMMLNYNNQSISSLTEPAGTEEELDATESSLPSVKPPNGAELVVPTSQNAACIIISSKPEVIKNVELTSAQIQVFNPDAIQSLVAQSSILGQATVDNVLVSSTISISKLLIATLGTGSRIQ